MNLPDWLKSRNPNEDKIKKNIRTHQRKDLRIVLKSGEVIELDNARPLIERDIGEGDFMITYANLVQILDVKFSEIASIKSVKSEGKDWDFEKLSRSFEDDIEG